MATGTYWKEHCHVSNAPEGDQRATQPSVAPEQRINDPQFHPWAGFRNATTALSPDGLDRHDEYLAGEVVSSHESE
jgi:hypothetical protein